MSAPRATYRLQLHAGFGFADAVAIVPYLARLGISHVYLSPILTARRGSPHGYDVVDPTTVNPELGGEKGLRGLVERLREAGLGLVLDIVPNHLAVGPENPWWQDVLAHGRASRWARVFDIDWHAEDPALRGKLLCPLLDRPYGEALAAGALVLEADAVFGYSVRHHETTFPIAPAGHAAIARAGVGAFDPRSIDGRQRLHRLLERQHYRLAWWRTAGDEINWRRFFDISELAGVRVEDEDVFEWTHATILRLYREGLLDGLRVDHVDGLADPEAYCRRLRARLEAAAAERPPAAPDGPAWLLVEKILAEGEDLPGGWRVDGTTGYDFMDQAGSLLHHPEGAVPLAELWAAKTGRAEAFEAEEVAARREIIHRGFTSQLEGVVSALHRVARLDAGSRDCTRAAIRRCIVALLAHFPAYRTYATPAGRIGADGPVFHRALHAAADDLLPADRPMLRQIDRWLGGTAAPPGMEGPYGAAIRRFQQLSAPVAAKAVEDTAFYRSGRLLSRNEVGSTPALFARTADEFHQLQRLRARRFPSAMLATATHDHKRGEDVRARLAVLSEIPDEWGRAVGDWLPTEPAPSAADAMMLCQMIVGAWPLDLVPDDREALGRYAARLAEWQVKALREAKLATDWTAPDEGYEAAARRFLDHLLAIPATARSLAAFARRIAPAGAVNGLAQLLLRLTAPGVPDTYQGTEFWDLSLVDPDNRRPVDFRARDASLDAASPMAALMPAWRDGRIKQALLARVLAFRRTHPRLFSEGTYEAVAAVGSRAAHLVAFSRRGDGHGAIVVVPRWPAAMLGSSDGIAIPTAAWGDTRLRISAAGAMQNILTGLPVIATAGEVAVADLLDTFPVALIAID